MIKPTYTAASIPGVTSSTTTSASSSPISSSVTMQTQSSATYWPLATGINAQNMSSANGTVLKATGSSPAGVMQLPSGFTLMPGEALCLFSYLLLFTNESHFLRVCGTGHVSLRDVIVINTHWLMCLPACLLTFQLNCLQFCFQLICLYKGLFTPKVKFVYFSQKLFTQNSNILKLNHLSLFVEINKIS